jgi:hypothetical protein
MPPDMPKEAVTMGLRIDMAQAWEWDPVENDGCSSCIFHALDQTREASESRCYETVRGR